MIFARTIPIIYGCTTLVCFALSVTAFGCRALLKHPTMVPAMYQTLRRQEKRRAGWNVTAHCSAHLKNLRNMLSGIPRTNILDPGGGPDSEISDRPYQYHHLSTYFFSIREASTG